MSEDASLVRKLAEKVQLMYPEMGSHINVTQYRQGKFDGLALAVQLLEAEAERLVEQARPECLCYSTRDSRCQAHDDSDMS